MLQRASRFDILFLMFIKLTKSGGHTYVQLVESYRDESSRPRQRTVCTLGRLDEVGGQVDSRVRHQTEFLTVPLQ